MRHSNERGIALITTLLVMMLISALLIAFTTVVMTDQRYRFIDKDRSQAFYGAASGVEKLTADLGNTFLTNVAPTTAQITALTTPASQPSVPTVTYTAINAPTPLPASEVSANDCNNGNPPDGVTRAPVTVGANGYNVTFCANTATGNPTTLPGARTISFAASPYAGLYGLKSPYQIDVTAKTTTGGEVHLTRTIETVAIPVFQFGIFSDVDLTFHSGDNFAFGGRVHTNGNLFLAVGAGNTLTLSDKVTAWKDIVRSVLPNGNSITNTGHTGTVNMTKGNGTYRALASLAAGEGSVNVGPGSTPYAGWTALSLSTYNGWIKDGAAGAARGTGAKQLTLPIVAPGVGGQNIDVIRRPQQGENVTSVLYGERMFNKASIRVILSDTLNDITNIPGVDNTAPPRSLEAGNSYPNAVNVFVPGGAIPVATPLPAPAWANTQLSTGAAIAAGTNVNISFQAGAVPASMKLPAAMVAGGGANFWNVGPCTGKTLNSFTGCTIAKVGNPGSTMTAGTAITSAALPGLTATVSANLGLAGGGPWAGQTIFVNTTLNFSTNTFWVDDQRVTCTGYSAAGQLTGCNVTLPIPAGERIDVAYRTTPVGTSTLGGYIKVERQNQNDSTWHDITVEMLNYGIAGPAQVGTCSATDPSPNAILRIERLADDSGTVGATPCAITANGRPIAAAGTDYWPNTLYDAREAWQRGSVPPNSNIKIGGVMHYIAIDTANLAKWFAGQAPYTNANGSTGTLSKTDNTGYSIYISDRRNNRDTNSKETAEWGWEDFVNPLDAANGAPNGVLDTGEDLNANTTLETYGGKASCNGQYNTFANGGVTCTDTFFPQLVGGLAAINPLLDLATTAAPILDSAANDGVARAMTNRAIMFRRAVKLINGGNLVASVNGFTVVSENPVYVQGDWNVTGGNYANAHASTAILADAVSILSNAWTDPPSYWYPYTPGNKLRSAASWYRVAVLSGKGAMFPLPAGVAQTDFGSDGGVHNFLRYLEGSPGGDTVNYMGSIASLYYNRQAVGLYKGTIVYGVPAARSYQFDQDFLDPSKLPPLTPMFRDMDTVGFSQNLQPGR